MFNDVKQLDPNDFFQKEVLVLVKDGLLDVLFDKENEEIMVMITNKGIELISDTSENCSDKKFDDALSVAEVFSKKAEKDLTEMIQFSKLEE